MSLKPDRPFWAGTGFRLSLVLAVTLWIISSLSVVSIVVLMERALYGELEAELNEEISYLGEWLQATEWPLEVHDLEPDDEELELDLEQLEPIFEQLWHRFEDSDGDDDLARNQLWLMGEHELEPELESIAEAQSALTSLLSGQVPPPSLPLLEQKLSRKINWLTLQSSWPGLTPGKRLKALEAFIMQEWGETRCYVFYADDGSDITNLASFTSQSELGGFSVYRVVLKESRLGLSSTCLMRDYNLNMNQRVLFGVPDNPMSEALSTIYQIRNWALPISFLLSLALAASFGARLTRKLNQVHRVTSNVMAGDLSSRTQVKIAKDDFDSLAIAIDQMLDHIQRLMNGVKDVSDNISHDLRTPLTRLRNRIDQLSQQTSIEPADMHDLSRDADQLLETFSALLRISQLEQGSHRRSFEPFDLVASLEDIHELFEPVFEAQQIRLTLDITTRKQMVLGDKDLWMQVLTNLLENALRYAPESNMVTLHLHIESGAAVVEVKDQGPGVPEAQLDRVLERFYRGDQSRGTTGTGLGLSLVAAVCQAMNIKLILLNEQGLTVKLYWPT